MKKIWNVLAAVALVSGMAGCGSICKKHCEDAAKTAQDSESANKASAPNDSTLDSEISLFNSTFAPQEYVFDDGTGDGNNICLSLDYDKGEGIFQLLTIKNGKIEKSTPATWKLDGKSCIEFSMSKDAFGKTQFKYELIKSKDALANAAFLRIPSADAEVFYLKLGDSVSTKVLANANQNGMALIGGQDTREGFVNMYYVSANLEADTVRMHAVKDVAGQRVNITLSSNEPIVKSSGSKKFPIADIGIPVDEWNCSKEPVMTN